MYCSTECEVKSKHQAQNLLFGLDPVLPTEIDHGMALLSKPARARAQAELVAYIKRQTSSASLMAARIVARQIAVETAKLIPGSEIAAHVEAPYSAGDGDYGLADHLERLRFTKDEVDASETQLVCSVLAAAIPGLESSLTQKRHGHLKGKVAYNAIGVCYNGGRDDKVSSWTLEIYIC